MQFTATLAAAILATVASAAPSTRLAARETIASGTDQNGSIFQFGDAAAARSTLYTAGACGLSTYFADQVDPAMPLVAMPSGVFDQYGASQNNQLCAKVITMTNNGVTQQAVVADRNLSADNSIDMTSDLWVAFGGVDGDGTLIPGFSWTIDA